MILAFDLLVQEVDSDADHLRAAFKRAVDQADTVQELEALRAAWQRAGAAGKLSAEQMRRGLFWLDEKLAETKEKAKEIGDGFDTAEDKARKALEKMRGELKKTRDEIDNTRTAAQGIGDSVFNASGSGSRRGGGLKVQTYSSQIDYNRIRGDQAAIEKERLNVQAELEKEIRYQNEIGLDRSGGWARGLSDARMDQIRHALTELEQARHQARQLESRRDQANRSPSGGPTTGLQPITINLPGQPPTTVFAQPGDETAFIDLLANLSRTTMTRR